MLDHFTLHVKSVVTKLISWTAYEQRSSTSVILARGFMTCQERAANGSLLAQVAAAAVAKVAEEGGRRIKQLSQRGARLARPPTVRLARMRGAKLVMWSGKVDRGGRQTCRQTQNDVVVRASWMLQQGINLAPLTPISVDRCLSASAAASCPS